MGKTEAVRVVTSTVNLILTLSFAPECAACGMPLDRPVDGCVCAACWLAIAPAPHVDWPAGPLADAAAGGDYDGSLRAIVHAFKYDGRTSLARPLAGLMRAQSGRLLDDADWLVPVPLHPWRRMRRGFNQSTELARALGIPVRPLLWRVRPTHPQADLNASQRLRNVSQAFRLSPLLSARAQRDLRGRVVVLVDDVRTTGATLHACAEVLERAGVGEVRAITAAVRAAA